ncbi:MAG: thioredoxin domain-containing protein [Candidatus Magasanikbacteria bacterium]|nr:thioredoxin domain-containing protein [Candidatus Magasanikbacteria bacterium]
MPSTKKLLIIFIPAIFVSAFALFIRVMQYSSITNSSGQDEIQSQSLLPIHPEDPIIGHKKSPITIIVFGDFACEACRVQDNILEKLIKKYPEKIKVIWKGLPVARFPYKSEPAHRYAYCANKQEKFDQFAKLAFTNSDNLSPTAIGRIVQEIKINQEEMLNCLNNDEVDQYIVFNKQLATSLGIQAVPAIFINDKQIKTPNSLDEWESILQL